MRRAILALVALVVVAGAAFAWVDHTQPAWWVRLRYPLYYRDSIVGYGHKYHLDPALIAAVVYEESRFKANSKSSAGAIGLMQLLPSTARGHRDAHRRDEVRPAPRPLRRRPEPPLRELVPGPPAAEVRRTPERRRPGAGGLQRRPDERRRLDPRDARRPAGRRALPRDPRLRGRRPPPRVALPQGVRRRPGSGLSHANRISTFRAESCRARASLPAHGEPLDQDERPADGVVEPERDRRPAAVRRRPRSSGGSPRTACRRRRRGAAPTAAAGRPRTYSPTHEGALRRPRRWSRLPAATASPSRLHRSTETSHTGR